MRVLSPVLMPCGYKTMKCITGNHGTEALHTVGNCDRVSLLPSLHRHHGSCVSDCY